MYKIYLIINVETKDIVYVGKTKGTLKRRFSGKHSFDKSLCDIKLIEETDEVGRERYWIEYYKNLGFNLYNKNNGDGYIPSLHSTFNYSEYRKEYYKKNREIILENSRNSKKKQKYNPETAKRTYEKNKESRLEAMKKWTNENREKWNEYQREYAKKKYHEKKQRDIQK